MWQFLTGTFPAIINISVMNISDKANLRQRRRLRPVLRAVVSVLLLTVLGMEILPWGFVESVSTVPGGQSERTFRIEPLQVCDHGDSFLGVLFDLPVLLPGAPCLFPSNKEQSLVQQAVAFIPDGFRPAIDHPPQLSA